MADLSQYDAIVEFAVGDSSHTAVIVHPVKPDFNPRTVHLFMASAFTYYSKAKKYSWEVKNHIRGATPYEHFYDTGKKWIPTGMIPRARDYLRMQYGNRVGITISKEIRNMYSPPFGQITRKEIEEYAKTLNIHDRETGRPLNPYEHQYRLRLAKYRRRFADRRFDRHHPLRQTDQRQRPNATHPTDPAAYHVHTSQQRFD